MDETQLTPEDLRAAEQFLLLHPDRLPTLSREVARCRLALVHAEMGARRFALLFGLRPPDDPKEAADLAYSRGEITEAEFYRRWHEGVRRPIDQRMLAVFFDTIDQMIVAYDRFRREIAQQAQQLVTKQQSQWDYAQIAVVLEPLKTRSDLAPEELDTVYQFLAEVRFEHQANLLPITDATFGSAAGQWFTVRSKALNLAELIQKRSMSNPLAPATVLELLQQQFPVAANLRTEVMQELAAARLTLSQRHRLLTSASPPPNTATAVVIQATHCQVQATTIEMQSRAATLEQQLPTTTEDTAKQQEDSPPVLAIPSWRELALGIMPDRSIRAFSPALTIGHRLRVSDGVVLALKGERWRTLLDLASQTRDGRSITRGTFVSHLITKGTAPKRHPPVSRETANADGLRDEADSEARRVRSLLADLRRELRELVNGPNDGSDTLLRDTGSAIELGFVCQVLVPDANGNYTFGLAVP